MYARSHSNKDQAVSKTLLKVCRVWALSGPNVLSYQMPCVYSGLITIPGSTGAMRPFVLFGVRIKPVVHLVFVLPACLHVTLVSV